MPTPVSQVIVEDRYTQITDLLRAARINAEVHTGLALMHIYLSVMYQEEIPKEIVLEWVAQWFDIRAKSDELRANSVQTSVEDFMKSVLDKQDKES